jgi:hypothetical protein
MNTFIIIYPHAWYQPVPLYLRPGQKPPPSPPSAAQAFQFRRDKAEIFYIKLVNKKRCEELSIPY